MPRRKLNDLSIPGRIWQQPSGRWSARAYATSGTIERPQATFDTQEEARQYLIDLDKRQRLGRYIAPADLTVGELIDQYLDRGELYDTWRPVTLHRHRLTARLHLIPALGHLRVQSVTRARLQHWLDGMARQHGASLLANCMAVLNGAFRSAVKMEIIDTSPSQGLERPPEKRTPMHTWTAAESRAVLDTLADEPMWSAVYHLFLSAGLRQGELRALVWSDVRFDQRQLLIPRTMTLDAEGHSIVGNATKTDTPRAVALTNRTFDALMAWQAAQDIRSIRPETDFVFSVRAGRPLPNTRLQTKHRQIIAATGVPPIRVHDMRHTFGSSALGQGMDIKVVSEIMGHSKVQTTMDRYQHVSVDVQRSVIDTLEERIFGSES